MFVTLGIIITALAIMVFFSKEFGMFAEKILDKPGMRLLLPLILASWLILSMETWVFWFFTYSHVLASLMAASISMFLPRGNYNQMGAEVIFLTLVVILVSLLLKIYTSRGVNQGFTHGPMIVFMIWLYFAILWIQF